MYNVITKNKYKKRVKIYKNLKSNFIPKKNSTIITSYSLQRKKVIDINSGKTKNEEFFIKPVLDELKNKHQPYLCVDLDYTLKGDTAILQERIKSVDDWIPIDILLNKKKSDSTQETISSLKKSVNELISYDLKSKFIYKKISVWTYLKPFFEDIFLEPYLPSYVHLVEELEKFLKDNVDQGGRNFYEGDLGTVRSALPQAVGTSESASDSGASDYSTTNIQVEGVDEADIVKNDGKYIYVVTGNKLVIIDSYPVDQMDILSEIEFLKKEKEKHFTWVTDHVITNDNAGADKTSAAIVDFHESPTHTMTADNICGLTDGMITSEIL